MYRLYLVLVPRQLVALQCLPQCGLFSPFVRTARFWVTEWGNQILTNMNFIGIDMLYKLQKRKFAKGHFKGQKRSLDCFFNQSMPTWSISPWKMKNEKVHESILECRYGSQLQTPQKNLHVFIELPNALKLYKYEVF